MSALFSFWKEIAFEKGSMGRGRCGYTGTVFFFFFLYYLLGVVFGEVLYSIPEEMQYGSFVGNVALDLNLDVKELTARRARVVSEGKRQYCDLSLETGFLFVSERIDREELCRQVSKCTLHFQILVENPLKIYSISVEIQDINDNTPKFDENKIRLEITESAAPGIRFSLESAQDTDAGTNSIQSYTLSPNEYFTLDVNTRAGGSQYPELVLEKALDRETQSEHFLILNAIDGGNPRQSGSVNIHVIVLDINDNAPVFTQPVYKVTIFENSPIGTLVVTVNATDIDEGVNGAITYTFKHISDEARDIFQIDSRTGEIRVVGNVNFEETKVHEIDVQARDGAGQSSFSHFKLLVEIIDVNDNAPVISLKSVSSSVPEDSLPGTVVAVINIYDEDSGKSGQVRCFVPVNLPFKIISEVKNYYMLVTDRALDREVESEFNVTITATDEGSPPLSSIKTITISVSDVNDNPPIFTQPSYTAYLMENQPKGTRIITVKAKDKDADQNGKVMYSFMEDSNQVLTLSSYVSINSESGDIFSLRPFDYEQFGVFQIHVKAQDRGNPPLYSNTTVKVFIVDQNDNAPKVLYPKQNERSVLAEMIPRSAHTGYLVTKVVAVDADSGHNAWLSYHQLKTTETELFIVGLHNGEIRTSRQIFEKDDVKQRLVIVVKDNGRPSHSATITLNLVLGDNFPLLSELSDFSDDTNSNTNLTLYLVISLACVSSLFFVLIIAVASIRFCKGRHRGLFYNESNANLPVFPDSFFPPNYADVEGTGALQPAYRYGVCLTTDSTKSEFKYVRACTGNTLNNQHMDPGNYETILHKVSSENDVYKQQKPANTDWRFSQGQRPGPSGSQRPEEAGPWPNPPTEAEQLQALMAAANEVSAATATLDAGTMGLSTRYSPQFTLQHVPDYRQNVYIPGSTSTLTGSNSQAEGKNPQPSSGNKKKSGKKEKK
ncbi:protocadherin gamma-A11-like isoform X1 [Acipenser ruthenus]|uniref:protocadherin gamma-A11-like isoform X1 n=1 Tax=Acipenser ruthenus TaxID=7906 RepID=UPI0027406679|nr:protocadherin gamma-A11-like isoform X1 [Acipenser ruthenus]